jgi:hypothetical protein
MKAPQGQGSPEPIGAGTHHGVCYTVVDLGTHHGEYQGKPIVKRQVQLGFEIPAERIEVDGKDLPRTMRAWYTFSMYKQAPLCKDIEAWQGKVFATQEDADNFELESLLGQNTLITSVINKNGYDKVQSLGMLMAGMETKKAENEFLYYSIDEHGLAIPDNIYEKMVEKIKASDEYKELLNPSQPSDEPPIGEDTTDHDDKAPWEN